MLATTRAIAAIAGDTRYFTGVACTHGHVAERVTRNGDCVACAKVRADAARDANPEKERARKRASMAKHGRPPLSEKGRAAIHQWRRENPERVAAHAAQARAAKLKATPVWAERKAIEEVYALAAFMSKTTGVVHHVDHIVPLQGKTVCGLHVAANLQVIPASENWSKRNHFWPDMATEN